MQATDVTAQALADEVLIWFGRVMRGADNRIYEVLEELDVTIGQTKVLQDLHSCGCEISVKEVGNRLSLSLPAASRSIDALVQRGWLERREDPSDRRSKLVQLTPAGEVVVERLTEARRNHIASYAEQLTGEQRARLLSALQALPTEPTS